MSKRLPASTESLIDEIFPEKRPPLEDNKLFCILEHKEGSGVRERVVDYDAQAEFAAARNKLRFHGSCYSIIHPSKNISKQEMESARATYAW